MPISSVRVAESVGRTLLELRAEELRLKRAARTADIEKNLANAIADLDVAFPWEAELRAVSPITSWYSHLRPYWYRYGQRWVLYDVLPSEAIDDELDTGSGVTGKDLRAIMAGPPPEDSTPVSPLQHAMWQRWNGFARPFWVLEGETGGHQVRFSPFQAQALLRMGLPSEPPKIGSLPPCPFDNRAVGQLRHLNRLHQFSDSVERLRASGSLEYARAEEARIEREVREAEMRFVEAQVRPLVDLAGSLSHRSEHDAELIHVESGMASRAKDAYERYRETGDWSM